MGAPTAIYLDLVTAAEMPLAPPLFRVGFVTDEFCYQSQNATAGRDYSWFHEIVQIFTFPPSGTEA